ncbi:MAG: peptide chain release factor 2 [Oscillospiraceae bacterium]|nr:peptide chain release factor 2 [Oscillospiraceae bacterium]
MIVFEEYKQRLGAARPALEELRRALDVAAKSKSIDALESQTQEADFWQDMENGQKIMREIKQLRNTVDKFNALYNTWQDLQTLCQLAIEEQDESLLPDLETGAAKWEKDMDNARLAALLSGEYDACGAIMSFHAGSGGTEAQDWADMLYRMYTRWAERSDLTYKILDYQDGDEAGIKRAVILIEGTNAFGLLKGEMGVHRLVRISPFDASGRRHTSFAAVEVMPELPDDIKIDIRDEDLKVDTYRSGGAGGQHVNKTESAIRITHIPSGIIVACQNERSQHQNRDMAMRMLRSKLVEIKEREHLDRIEDIKGEQKAIEWGSQIRSYVFMPYTLAKDHRTGHESGNISAVMDGDISGFISAFLTCSATGNWKRSTD